MRRVVVGALIGLLVVGFYFSRIGHGIWLARNLYVYGYEPNRERLRLQDEARDLKQRIEAFKERGKEQAK